MNIAIGIPTYNRPIYLIQTIHEVLKQDYSDAFEIIIVDQTPWDNIDQKYQLQILELKKHPFIKYHLQEKPNLPAARNQILKVAKGEIIIWIDDDVLLPPNFIKEHLKCYQNKKVIAVAGLPFHRKSDKIDPNDINFDNFKSKTAPHFEETSFVLQTNGLMVGANHSVRVNYAIQNKGYDENLTGSAFNEDSDFGKRLYKKFPNQYICYNPSAYLIHLKAKQGGCRINTESFEKDATFGHHLYTIRHLKGKEIIQFLLISIRSGPLRKINIIRPWRQPKAWFAFFKSLYQSYLLKDTIKSPFKNNLYKNI